MTLDEAYVDARDRYVQLVRGLTAEQLATVVPTCPAWTVKDLTAHLTSVCKVFVDTPHPLQKDDGKIDFDATDPARAKRLNDATEEEVVLRRDHTLEQVLVEWHDALPRALRVLSGEEPLPPTSAPTTKFAVVGDIALHLQDARGALGVTGDRTFAAASIAYESWLMLLAVRLPAAGLPALRIRDRVIGIGEPEASIQAEWYEVLRALSGRRSRDQMRAMFVDGDPERYVALLTTFEPPAVAILE